MFLHEKKEISKSGAYIDCVCTDRFRFASFSLTFSLGKLTFAERQALYALSRMMENGSREYPTPEALDIALAMMYDAEISFSFTECESGVLLHAEADFADTPAIGSDLLLRILSYIKSTLLYPFPEGDGADKLLARIKGEIKGDCDALTSDPDSYSYSAYKDAVYAGARDRLTFKGICDIPGSVTLEDVRKLHESVKRAPLVYAFYVGRADAERVSELICSHFDGYAAERVIPLSPCPDKSGQVREGPMGSSTRMYLGYSYSCPDADANILAGYLGGVPVSRLYTVLREKNRYCYSVYAERSNMGLFTVTAAVGTRYEARSREAVLDVIREACERAVPSVLSAAKEASLVAARYVYENRRACERFFFSAFVKRERADIEERMARIKAFDAKALSAAAQSLSLSAEYVLFGVSEPFAKKGYMR